jgi:hypothetical protein
MEILRLRAQNDMNLLLGLDQRFQARPKGLPYRLLRRRDTLFGNASGFNPRHDPA